MTKEIKPILKNLAIPKIKHADDETMLALMMSILVDYQRLIARLNPQVGEVFMTTKGTLDDPKDKYSTRAEFGYWPTRYIKELLDVIKHFKIHSFCDLGSGMGLLSMLIASIAKIPVKGIEIEDCLLEIAERTQASGFYCAPLIYQKGNLLELKREQIKDYHALYFWEPINNSDLCLKFITNLVNIMDNKQIIICQPAASSLRHLKENPKVEYLAHYACYHLFQLKREHK
jgi:2-polyprenyl-3-methyl-5-hydroxy-6-metoxy-1,4-benzoquinol methylase